MNSHLLYASYFSSYLLSEIKDFENLKAIILFGSVSRNEAKKSSDVDIFLEINDDEKKRFSKFEYDVKNIIEKFYESKDYLIFKNKGIGNKINTLVGKIEKFGELKESVYSDGIILYGKFQGNPIGKRKIILYWDKIGKNRGAFLNIIYGFKVGDKKYPGLLQKFNGNKVGKSSIEIPIEYKGKIFELLKKYKVRAKSREIYG